MKLFSESAESVVLAAILARPEILDDLDLRPDDFHGSRHRMIFEALLGCDAAGEPIDALAVWERCKAAGAEADVGELLIACDEGGASAAWAKPYAVWVKEFAAARRFATACGEAWQGASQIDHVSDVRPFVRKVFAEIADAADRCAVAAGSSGTAVGEVVGAEVQALERRIAGQDLDRRIPTGFADLDALIVGLEPADYVVVGARPSMGKTALGVQLAGNVAASGRAVSLFSLEQTTGRVVQRMISQRSGVPFSTIRSGRNWTDAMTDNVARAEAEIGGWRMAIRDDSGMTPGDIRSAAVRDAASGHLDLIVIDHLHHIRPDDKADSRYREVSAISLAIKNLAKDLRVPVVLLAQLSRDSAKAKRRPALSDLRDSGSVEEHSDLILLLHRDEYYDPTTSRTGIADVLVAKNRDGATGNVELSWRPQILSFGDLHRWEA